MVGLHFFGENPNQVRKDLIVVFLVVLPALYVFPHFRFLQHANEMPRLFVTESLVTKGSFAIDEPLRRHRYTKRMDLSRGLCLSAGLARAVRRSLHVPVESRCQEHIYSNKAPGPSVAAVPFYVMAGLWARLSGRKPTLADRLWWSRFGTGWLAMLLALLALAALGRRLEMAPGPRHAMLLAYGLGSMGLVYSVQFMSHQLAAAGAVTALALLSGSRPVPRWSVFGAGVAGSVALAADYQSAALLGILTIYGVGRLGPKRSLWAVLGALPVVAGLAWYHDVCFGWYGWTGYDFLIDRADLALHVKHPLGLVGPQAGPFRAILWSPREGLLFLSPWLFLVPIGLAGLLRRTVTEASPEGDGTKGRSGRSWLHLAPGQWARGFFLVGMLLVAAVVVDHATSGWIQGKVLGGFSGMGLAPTTGSSFPVVALAWWGVAWVGAVAIWGFRREWLGPWARVADAVSVGVALTLPVTDFLVQGPEGRVALWSLVAAWPVLGGLPIGFRVRKGAGVAAFWFFGLAAHQLPWQGSWHWVGWFVVAVWAMQIAWERSKNAASSVASGHAGRSRAEQDGRRSFSLGLVVLSAAVFYLWFVSSVTYWHGGWQVGPRYLALCLPLLALAAGMGFHLGWRNPWLRAGVGALVAVGLFVYVTTAAVFPHYPKSFRNPVVDLIWYLMSHGYVARNLGEHWFALKGVWGLMPLFLFVGLLWVAVFSGWTSSSGPPHKETSPKFGKVVSRLWPVALSALLAAVILVGYFRLPRTDLKRCCRWITTMWDREHSSSWDGR